MRAADGAVVRTHAFPVVPAGISASLSPDPSSVAFRNDGAWHRFTVTASEPVGVVANPAGAAPRVEIARHHGLSNSCLGEQHDEFERSSGQTVHLVGCELGTGTVHLVRLADGAVIRRYTLTIGDAGGEPDSLSPDPSTVAFRNDGALHRFTVNADEPLRIVSNPQGTAPRVGISRSLYPFFGPPCPAREDWFVVGDGHHVYVAGREAGTGTVQLERYGEVLRTYNFTIGRAPGGCVVEPLGTMAGETTRAGAFTSACESRNRRGSYARHYSFSLARESDVRIDLRSLGDPFLNLLSGAGTGGAVVAANDNSGEFLDSRIVRRLPAGAYTVEATTNWPQETGSFELTLAASGVGAETGGRFTDDPIVPGTTVVKAMYVTELRERIDALRIGHGLGRFPWTDRTIVPGVTPVASVHVGELEEVIISEVPSTGCGRPC